MNTLQIDEKLLTTLNAVSDLTELRDTNGRVIGFFAPATAANASSCVQAAAHFDRDEIQRLRNSKEKGSPTANVLKRLQKLEAETERRKAEGEPALTGAEAAAFVLELRSKESTQ